MPTLNYASPTTVDEAVRLLADSAGLAKALSGGTDSWSSCGPAGEA